MHSSMRETTCLYLIGMATLLLSAIDSTWMKTSIAPENIYNNKQRSLSKELQAEKVLITYISLAANHLFLIVFPC